MFIQTLFPIRAIDLVLSLIVSSRVLYILAGTFLSLRSFRRYVSM